MAWSSRAVDGDLLEVVSEAMLHEEPGSFVVVTDGDAETPDAASERFAFVIPEWGFA